jgi:cytochrome P450
MSFFPSALSIIRMRKSSWEFSRGPRDCIGKYFAFAEEKLALSRLVTKYNLELVNPNETIRSQLTLLPKEGAQVKFTPRAN